MEKLPFCCFYIVIYLNLEIPQDENFVKVELVFIKRLTTSVPHKEITTHHGFLNYTFCVKHYSFSNINLFKFHKFSFQIYLRIL